MFLCVGKKEWWNRLLGLVVAQAPATPAAPAGGGWKWWNTLLVVLGVLIVIALIIRMSSRKPGEEAKPGEPPGEKKP